MRIIINGIEAVLKSGTSFDYVTENRYFTGADAYTMAITFPIAGCERNQRIFGNINRKDIQERNILMDCDIYAKNFHKKGSITVTEITDKAIKCQFLEGRSVDNYWSSLDEVYINELELGGYLRTSKDFYSPAQAYGGSTGSYISLPWCNNSSGIVHNGAVFQNGDKEGKWWNFETNKEDKSGYITSMPYLRYIFIKICDAIGYGYDVEEWDKTSWFYLLICNVVPETWDNDRWNFILPHWSVSQFFEECEKLMNCQVNVNHVEKKVVVKFYTEIIKSDNLIKLDNVVTDYNSEISDGDESEYQESSLVKYAECSHRMWPLYSLDWKEELINSPSIKSIVYGSFSNMTDAFLSYGAANYSYMQVGRLFCDNETNSLWSRYVIRRVPDSFYPGTGWDKVYLDVLSVGEFRPNTEDKGQKTVELSIVPVWLDFIERNWDNGQLLQTDKIIFLDCGELHNEKEDGIDEENNNQSKEFNLVKAGKKEATAIFDKLYVGFYKPDTYNKFRFQRQAGNYIYNLPHPIIEKINTLRGTQYSDYFIDDDTLKLDGNGTRKNTGISINQYEKFNIKFIANEIPDVYSIFLIEGRKFLCKKITATFKEDGMSQLLKGEFYQITG